MHKEEGSVVEKEATTGDQTQREVGAGSGAVGATTMLGGVAAQCRPGLIQRKLQRRIAQRARAAGEAAGGAVAGAVGAGSALPATVRAQMERSFNADFSAVRVHEGAQAASLGAAAYTEGNDIHFQPGRYDPASRAGLELLGHELAHVVQQRAGRVHAPSKDSPINEDPALESEADAMGARAARGEPTGLAATGAGGGSAIQRYRDETLDGTPWRLSDGGGILTPAQPTHDLYARGDRIAEAQGKLVAAKSFIALEPAPVIPGGQVGQAVTANKLLKVTPRYAPPEGQVPDKHKDDRDLAQKNLSKEKNPDGILRTFSDCNECGRLIMGAYISNESGDETNLEQPIGSWTGRDEVHERVESLPYKTPSGGKPAPTERGGVTVLSRALVAYRDSDHLREVATKGGPIAEQVTRFRELVALLKPETPMSSWQSFYVLFTSMKELYEDFVAWAKIDAKASPEVGDALVTYLYKGGPGAKVLTNPRVYESLQTGSEVVAGEAMEGIEKKHEGKVPQQLVEQYRILAEKLGAEKLKKMGVGKLLKKMAKEKMSETRLGVALLLNALAEEATEMGQQVIHAFDLNPNLTYDQLSQLISRSDEHDTKSQLLNRTFEEVNVWNMHWAGIIMTEETFDGAKDYCSLENDASTEKKGRVNDRWRFQLYGNAKPKQSFHEQMMRSGDFANFASTMAYRHASPDQLVKGPKGPSVTVIMNPNAREFVLSIYDNQRGRTHNTRLQTTRLEMSKGGIEALLLKLDLGSDVEAAMTAIDHAIRESRTQRTLDALPAILQEIGASRMVPLKLKVGKVVGVLDEMGLIDEEGFPLAQTLLAAKEIISDKLKPYLPPEEPKKVLPRETGEPTQKPSLPRPTMKFTPPTGRPLPPVVTKPPTEIVPEEKEQAKEKDTVPEKVMPSVPVVTPSRQDFTPVVGTRTGERREQSVRHQGQQVGVDRTQDALLHGPSVAFELALWVKSHAVIGQLIDGIGAGRIRNQIGSSILGRIIEAALDQNIGGDPITAIILLATRGSVEFSELCGVARDHGSKAIAAWLRRHL